MNKLFGYPEYDNEGKKVLTTTDGLYKDMLMNITVYRMKNGDVRDFYLENEELAVLLVTGDVEYQWDKETRKVKREDCFKESLYCLHVCKGVKVTIKAFGDTEILVQSTENEKEFSAVFYTPEDCVDALAGKGLCEPMALRTVRTAFDYQNAPYSNMVLGEIIGHQGGWSGYIPHHHPQPEVYYYRFDKPQGFGACFIGDDVFKIKDGSFSALTPGATHPQVTAPGYPMYVVWMIRHLEGNPWTDRVDDPDHTWMVDSPIQYR
ncbi:5-deoxy-glucuronate isomerase [Anaerosacchariphilus polymeriproducens]|uniref:5-deoxyglucuronate isomerase n=1 Tax=Anaerosacchariphilus polymeriproducens TaxID=1812858 RepID=A0A371ARY4_9FIRM|nr:5-deoxy-glucuronate isomerase [Anaerosacchariphilus polymeriproducens]RDU22333.1 5-deoxyglucuronate isomerase [Anaerosacchariphilus polymeriproducens]